MVADSNLQQDRLARFGFRFGRSGVHLARSMMLADLRRLLQYVPEAAATGAELANAVLQDNCLGKRSARTRALTLGHLRSLYGLSPAIPLYRTLRYFWRRDVAAQPLLACLVAFARDPVLRLSASYILQTAPGERVDTAGIVKWTPILGPRGKIEKQRFGR